MAEDNKDVVENTDTSKDDGSEKGELDSIVEASKGDGKTSNHDRLLQKYGQDVATMGRKVDDTLEAFQKLAAQVESIASNPRSTPTNREDADLDAFESEGHTAKKDESSQLADQLQSIIQRMDEKDKREADAQRRAQEAEYDRQLLSIYPKAENQQVLQEIFNVANHRIDKMMPMVNGDARQNALLTMAMQVASEAAAKDSGTTSPTDPGRNTISGRPTSDTRITDDSARTGLPTTADEMAQLDMEIEQIAQTVVDSK